MLPARLTPLDPDPQPSLLNAVTAPYGLSLSSRAYQTLLRDEETALCDAGRIDFGGGVLSTLAEAFCPSPFIQQHEWAQTLSALLQLFYAFKNDLPDGFSDDALIRAMVRAFDGRARGSLRILADFPIHELLHPSPTGRQEDDDEFF